MTGLLILVLFAGALAIACAWADSRPPVDDDEFTQSTHCRVVDDAEIHGGGQR